MAKQGCKLILWDINEKENEDTAEEIRLLGGQGHAYTVDVSKREQVYSNAEKVSSIENWLLMYHLHWQWPVGFITYKRALSCKVWCKKESENVNKCLICTNSVFKTYFLYVSSGCKLNILVMIYAAYYFPLYIFYMRNKICSIFLVDVGGF